MRGVFSIPVAVAALAVQVLAQKPTQTPIEAPLVGAERSQGCFKSAGSLKEGYSGREVTKGYCHNKGGCPKDSLVFATKGTQCFCGSEYPPVSARVDDSFCDFPCPGYPFEACGAIDAGNGSYYSVYNNGVEVDVKFEQDASSTTSGSSPPTQPGSPSGSNESKSGDKKSSTNVGGIVAGVVVGILAIAGIVGGIFFYMRRKRNQEIEEEHRRNAAVSAFVGGNPPSSSGGLSISDSRLDPVMAQRRMSDGSIADNHDYSRKILRVTNA